MLYVDYVNVGRDIMIDLLSLYLYAYVIVYYKYGNKELFVTCALFNIFVLLVVMCGVVAAALSDSRWAPASVLLFFIAPLLAYIVVRVSADVALTNYAWQHTTIGPNRFDARLEMGPMLRIYLVNLLLIVLTFGLWIPFAKVNVTRYRVEHLSLQMRESMDRFLAAEQDKLGALGEEFGDALDLDLGL